MLLILIILSFFCFGSPTIIAIKNLNVPPSVPINSKEIILSCEYESHGDEIIKKVQWFFDKQLFCEWFPESLNATKMGRLEKNVNLNYKLTSDNSTTLSTIKLGNISESLSGDYTCKIIGIWNEGEATKHMFIYADPKLAGIKYFPATVKKGHSLTLECLLEDPGFPKNISFIWFRRGYKIHETIEPKWVIEEASLDTRTTFSCMATNGPGKSLVQKISIDVVAPPTIIGKKSSYASVSYLAKEFSLSCRIECYPICSIIWYKDGRLLDTKNDSLYQEIVEYFPPDYTKNDFESVESTLIWKISNWPNGRLDKKSPLLKYTCASVSTENPGPDINFTTTVTIDAPPENLKLSSYYVNVKRGSYPPAIDCKGEGLPSLDYVWKDSSSAIIANGSILQLGKMSAKQAGYYVCEGYNRHGSQTAQVYINVQYKPKCNLTKGFIQKKPALVCTAPSGNPKKVSFNWEILYSNKTVNSTNVIVREESGRWYSYLILDSKSNVTMVYQCVAKNTIGSSYPCQIEVSGAHRKQGLLSWVFQILTLPAYYGLF